MFQLTVPSVKSHDCYISKEVRERLIEIVRLLGYINIRGKYQGRGNVSGFARALANHPQKVRDKLSSIIGTLELLESIEDPEPEVKTGPGRKPIKGKTINSSRTVNGKRVFDNASRIRVCATPQEWEVLKKLCQEAGYFTLVNGQRQGSVSALLDNFPREPRRLLTYLQSLNKASGTDA